MTGFYTIQVFTERGVRKVFNRKTWSFVYLATSFMFMCRLIVYTKNFCVIKTNATLFLPQQFKTFKNLLTRLLKIIAMLLHKNFGNLPENVMMVLCKRVILICKYVRCKPSNLRVKPSLNCDLYQFAHCFNFANKTK